jgi:Spy/CpxP family protein refolding chaperone
MGGLDTEKLKEQLGLSDEQVEKMNALNEANRAEMSEMREKMRSGEFDFSNMRELMTERREAQTKKINELLTPEQQEKFKKAQEERRSRWGQRGRGGRDGGSRGRRGGRDRGARVKENALKALGLDDEVAAVVTPLLDAVLKGRETDRDAQRTRREAFMKKLEGADEATVTTLLTEYRAENSKAEEARKKTAEDLREVLTLTQEAKLVGLGVLR